MTTLPRADGQAVWLAGRQSGWLAGWLAGWAFFFVGLCRACLRADRAAPPPASTPVSRLSRRVMARRPRRTLGPWPRGRMVSDVREVPFRLCRYKIATNVPPQGLSPLRAKPGGNRAFAGGPHCRTQPYGGAGKPDEADLTPSPRGQQRHGQSLSARYATKMSPEATGCVIRAMPPAFPTGCAGGEETLGRRAAGSSEARFYDMTMLWFSRDCPAFRRKPGRSGRRAGRDAPRRLPVPRRKGKRDNLVASHAGRRSRPRRKRRRLFLSPRAWRNRESGTARAPAIRRLARGGTGHVENGGNRQEIHRLVRGGIADGCRKPSGDSCRIKGGGAACGGRPRDVFRFSGVSRIL